MNCTVNDHWVDSHDPIISYKTAYQILHCVHDDKQPGIIGCKYSKYNKVTLYYFLENRSALLRVNLITLYSVMKAKRNTAQVSYLHFQH